LQSLHALSFGNVLTSTSSEFAKKLDTFYKTKADNDFGQVLTLISKEFNPKNQHDVGDFYRYLLNLIYEVKEPQISPEVSNVNYWQELLRFNKNHLILNYSFPVQRSFSLGSHNQCTASCSLHFNADNLLVLQIKSNHKDLIESIKLFNEPEEQTTENLLRCSTCNQETKTTIHTTIFPNKFIAINLVFIGDTRNWKLDKIIQIGDNFFQLKSFIEYIPFSNTNTSGHYVCYILDNSSWKKKN